ncbi:selT/selW/selH seleno protein domain-containing protein [Leptodontidium sp. MPI-SDFR-AT-0119]|nr:selT/selW/selH seleno protein domain-containing protein [Leptodontidium sp. MPI-SDFR-AT-0119]
MENQQNGPLPPRYPRVTIEFCTQCKWLLRAAYFAQELMSTFSTSLGEVALQPSTGGTFIVNLQTESLSEAQGFPVTINQHLLWDRKAEGGFPETKELKRRVRDIIDPKRDLGHVDGKKSTSTNAEPSTATSASASSNPSSQEPTPQNTTGTNTPIPRAINRLHAAVSGDERKFTPMDVDVNSRPGSSRGDVAGELGGEGGGGEVLNSRGKIQVGGENEGGGSGYCRPGEDCEDCA